jgi:hypothetical protein
MLGLERGIKAYYKTPCKNKIHYSIISPDFYESLTLREKYTLRVFENRVMRIFGPKREGNREMQMTAKLGTS